MMPLAKMSGRIHPTCSHRLCLSIGIIVIAILSFQFFLFPKEGVMGRKKYYDPREGLTNAERKI